MNLSEFGFTNATPAIPPSCVLAEPLERHMEDVGQYSAVVLALTFDSGPPERPTATSYVFYFFRSQVDPNRPPDDILTFKIKAVDPGKIFIVDKYLGGVDFGAENAPPLAKRGAFAPGTLSKGDEAKIAALAERLIENRKLEEKEEKKSASRFCGQCGARNAAIENFCTECGSPLQNTQSVGVTALPIPMVDQRSHAAKDSVPFAATKTADSQGINGLLSSGVVYVIAYLIVALPTYVLPYFGSNSSVLNVFGAATGLGALPQFWFHLVALYLLIVVTWIRGGFIGKQWLAIFPVLAAIFDMVPGFSVIPLLPTVFHVLALVLGVSGNRVVVEDAADGKRRLIISAVGLAAVVTLAFVKTQTFFLNAKQGPSWESPNTQQLPDELQIKKDLIGQTMGTWRFSSLAEILELKIDSKRHQADSAEYDVNMVLQDTKKFRAYSATATIVYRKVGGAWKLTSISKKSFENYQT